MNRRTGAGFGKPSGLGKVTTFLPFSLLSFLKKKNKQLKFEICLRYFLCPIHSLDEKKKENEKRRLDVVNIASRQKIIMMINFKEIILLMYRIAALATCFILFFEQ
jgi:hypothetical protein